MKIFGGMINEKIRFWIVDFDRYCVDGLVPICKSSCGRDYRICRCLCFCVFYKCLTKTTVYSRKPWEFLKLLGMGILWIRWKFPSFECRFFHFLHVVWACNVCIASFLLDIPSRTLASLLINTNLSAPLGVTKNYTQSELQSVFKRYIFFTP